MSGTSMDGVDISLIKTNGQKIIRQNKNFYLKYQSSTKLALLKIKNQTLKYSSYIHETKPLGTAGALTLLPKNINHPLIVMNGDILTDLNFGKFYDNHLQNKSLFTIGANKRLQTLK